MNVRNWELTYLSLHLLRVTVTPPVPVQRESQSAFLPAESPKILCFDSATRLWTSGPGFTLRRADGQTEVRRAWSSCPDTTTRSSTHLGVSTVSWTGGWRREAAEQQPEGLKKGWGRMREGWTELRFRFSSLQTFSVSDEAQLIGVLRKNHNLTAASETFCHFPNKMLLLKSSVRRWKTAASRRNTVMWFIIFISSEAVN